MLPYRFDDDIQHMSVCVHVFLSTGLFRRLLQLLCTLFKVKKVRRPLGEVNRTDTVVMILFKVDKKVLNPGWYILTAAFNDSLRSCRATPPSDWQGTKENLNLSQAQWESDKFSTDRQREERLVYVLTSQRSKQCEPVSLTNVIPCCSTVAWLNTNVIVIKFNYIIYP